MLCRAPHNIQRFDSSLALNFHLHALLPDGVFCRDDPDDEDARPRFRRLPPPTDAEVATLLARIAARVVKMLRRHGRLGDDDAQPEDALALTIPGIRLEPAFARPFCARTAATALRPSRRIFTARGSRRSRK